MISENILDELRRLSLLATGYSSPNPPVACVITDLTGKIISSAHTQRTGENHAEREVYFKLGENFSEPHIVYVTLEPCTHFGKTPPCLDLILKYKPLRVYYGMKDPNPLVKERDGFEICRKNSIEVVFSPEIENISKSFLNGFGSRIQSGRPQIIWKSAVSSEGFFARKDRKPERFSSQESDFFSSILRSRVDGILVGPATVAIDSPWLNFRAKPFLNIENYKKIEDPFFDSLFSITSNDYDIIKKQKSTPLRFFVLSENHCPNVEFFNKQAELNKDGKTVILVMKSNEVFEIIRAMGFKNIFLISEKLEIMDIIKKLKLNRLIFEGGNFVYSLIQPEKSDLVIRIKTNKSIGQGILPLLPESKHSHLISVGKDVWEIQSF